jgi:hypothetical protein
MELRYEWTQAQSWINLDTTDESVDSGTYSGQ